MAMMVYSKGGDTTNCHMRYWKLCRFCGMCRVRGLALMAKSMQALCGQRRRAGVTDPRPGRGVPRRRQGGGGGSRGGTSFFSRLYSSIILSPCSWKVMMIKATKMLTKKKGKTTK